MFNSNSFLNYNDFLNPNPMHANLPLPPANSEIVAPCPNPQILESVMQQKPSVSYGSQRPLVNEFNKVHITANSEEVSMNDVETFNRVHELETLQKQLNKQVV